MPEICRFFGIVISMPPNDHLPPPPRFARTFKTIETNRALELSGGLPLERWVFVTEWTALHREELRLNWVRLRAGRPTIRVAPLE